MEPDNIPDKPLDGESDSTEDSPKLSPRLEKTINQFFQSQREYTIPNPDNLPVYWATVCTSGYLICDTAHRHQFVDQQPCVDCPICGQSFGIHYYYGHHHKFCKQRNQQYRSPADDVYYHSDPSQPSPRPQVKDYRKVRYQEPSIRSLDPFDDVYGGRNAYNNWDDPYTSRVNRVVPSRLGSGNWMKSSSPVPKQSIRMADWLVDTEPVKEPEPAVAQKECNHDYDDPDCFYCDKDPLGHL